MAPKRPSPLDEPPAASSTEEEEEEEEEASSEEEQASGSDSGSDDDDDDEADDPKTSPSPSIHAAPKKTPSSSKKDDHPYPPPAAANSNPHSSSSGSGSEAETESESGSDTETDSTRRPTKAADPNASRPMEDTPAATKKPRLKSNTTPAAKRPSEEDEAKDSKPAKKKKGLESKDEGTASLAEEEQKKPEDDVKKLFQRLWSEDDEIVILKGMIDYTAKKGIDPSADMNAFHDFIKKSLQINVSKAQLADKVRRLKKKYKNNAGKGKKYNPTKPHELKAFELSKMIWGGGDCEGGGGGEEPKSNGKVRSKQKSNRSLALLKAELPNGGVSENLNEIVEFDKSCLPEHVMKKGIDLIAGSKKAELEDKWKKLHVAQLELYVKRTQLISEQTKFILDAYKKSLDH